MSHFDDKKLPMYTSDLTQANIEKIAQLFPQVITEAEDDMGNIVKKVDFDLLKQHLSKDLVEDTTERYRLDRPGKKKSLLKANTPINKTLRPVKEDSVNRETTENLYLEGDNFEVLKILQESYLGKIKMIYIDPPYNTGKDFVYKDDFKVSKADYEEETGVIDEEWGKLFKNTDTNGRYHSDWLSMMFSRLTIARDLLRDDGVIFMSIDDNEVYNLRKIADEIFGEENFKGAIIVENDTRARSYDSLATTHEYVLAYMKNASENVFNELFNNSKEFRYNDEEWWFDLYELRNRNATFHVWNRPNLYYAFWVNPLKYDNNWLYEISLEEKQWWIKTYPQESQWIKTVWRWSKETALPEINKRLFWKKTWEEFFQIVKKYREKTYVLNSVWSDKSIISDKWTAETKEVFDNKKLFDFPKPLNLINRFLTLSTNSNSDDIVLDFFSWSATTAHAVMQLNAEDEGKRKWIMVQLPEETDNESEAYKAGYKAITEIGKERIRRAGKKILEDHKEKLAQRETPIDIWFRVYRTDSTNMKKVFSHPSAFKQDQLELFASNIKDDRTPEDLLTQVMLDLGLTLDLPIEQKKLGENIVFFVAENALVACFDQNINFAIIDEIASLQPLKVVFRDASFFDDKDRINLENRFKRLSPETKISVL